MSALNSTFAVAIGALSMLLCRGNQQTELHKEVDTPTVARPRADEVLPDSLVRALVINGVGLRIGSAVTLSQAQTTLGTATVHNPRHHGDPAWICYEMHLPSDSVYLLLKSDGIGAKDWLGSFEVSESPPRGIDVADCSRTTNVRSIITDNGLYLGMPISQLLAIMHAPSEHVSGRYVFQYDRIVRRPGHEPYDQSATLEVHEKAGRVVMLQASYSELS